MCSTRKVFLLFAAAGAVLIFCVPADAGPFGIFGRNRATKQVSAPSGNRNVCTDRDGDGKCDQHGNATNQPIPYATGASAEDYVNNPVAVDYFATLGFVPAAGGVASGATSQALAGDGCVDTDGDGICDQHGAPAGWCQDTSGDGKCDRCGLPMPADAPTSQSVPAATMTVELALEAQAAAQSQLAKSRQLVQRAAIMEARQLAQQAIVLDAAKQQQTLTLADQIDDLKSRQNALAKLLEPTLALPPVPSD